MRFDDHKRTLAFENGQRHEGYFSFGICFFLLTFVFIEGKVSNNLLRGIEMKAYLKEAELRACRRLQAKGFLCLQLTQNNEKGKPNRIIVSEQGNACFIEFVEKVELTEWQDDSLMSTLHSMSGMNMGSCSVFRFANDEDAARTIQAWSEE